MKKQETGLTRASDVVTDIARLHDIAPPAVSRRLMGRIERIEVVNQKRDEGRQHLGYSSRPFVLTTLPVKRPKPGVRDHVRTNGDFVLEVTGHRDYGLPFGQDRLIPIWIASLAIRQNSRTVRFRSAAQLLDEFALPKDGRTYKRLVQGFQRIATSHISFGTNRVTKTPVWEWHQFQFFDSMRLWFSRDVEQPTLDGEFQNVIVLGERFWNEIQAHPIPVDLSAVRALTDSPAAMDLYIWLVWRARAGTKPSSIPLFGDTGLIHQLGGGEYTRRANFRLSMKRWLERVRLCWPECPATLSEDGNYLLIFPGRAIHERTITLPPQK